MNNEITIAYKYHIYESNGVKIETVNSHIVAKDRLTYLSSAYKNCVFRIIKEKITTTHEFFDADEEEVRIHCIHNSCREYAVKGHMTCSTHWVDCLK